MIKLPNNLTNTTIAARWEKHDLVFKTPAKTSRETFKTKDTYLLRLSTNNGKDTGVGECSPLWTLSIDPREKYTDKLQWLCNNINYWEEILATGALKEFPSILFGLETALLDLQNGGKQIIYPSKFTEGNAEIEINGLIWMGDFEYMSSQIQTKIEDGFKCVKLKIGAIDWEQEKLLLQSIRKKFSAEEIELRVDANGAFTTTNAMEKLRAVADLQIHSIEQPIMAGQIDEMAMLCAQTPVPIALDEELISITNYAEKEALLQKIQPQYIILKPSLIGGIKSSQEWIELAEKYNVKWWATSALEGNIGLNAIAQFAYQTGNKMPQGLGTGQLFETNFKAPIYLDENKVKFNVAVY